MSGEFSSRNYDENAALISVNATTIVEDPLHGKRALFAKDPSFPEGQISFVSSPETNPSKASERMLFRPIRTHQHCYSLFTIVVIGVPFRR